MRKQGRAHAVIRALVAGCGRPAPWPILLSVLALSTVPQIAAAQRAEPAGRDFAGVRLPIPTVAGPIHFRASRVSVWSEAAPSDGASTRRLVLDGSVRVTLGDAVFESSRAFVWMQNLRSIGSAGGEYQVFVVFEDVGSSAAAAGPNIAARWLPVQGVIQTTDRPEMQADLVLQGRPAADTGLQQAEIELANHLRRHLGLVELAGGRTGDEDPRIWQPMPAPWVGTPAYAASPGDSRSPAIQAAPRGTPGDPGASPAAVVPSGDPAAAPAGTPAETPDRPDQRVPAERLIADTDAAAAAERIAQTIRALPPAPREPARPPVQGLVTLDTGDVVVQAGTEETLLIATGGVVIQSTDAITGRTMLLKAERAVIFHDPGSIEDVARLDREKFRGVYLEGAVMATNGQYTLRGQSVYYDLRADRAIVLDAVFNTYDERLRMPLYIRADAIRQEAKDEFTAEHPRLAASAFRRPLLTLGASSVTLRRMPGTDGQTRNVVDAENIALRAGALPFFYWPVFEGEPERFPLRGITVQSPGGSDGALRTTWDLLSLSGIDGPRDLGAQLEANLLADWYFERGLAGGVDASWATDRGEGSLLAYGILDDQGEDRTHSGTKLGHDGDNRGLILAEHRYRFSEHWTLIGELAYIGDETFIDAFFDSDGETRREFATGLTAQRLESNTAVTIQGRGSLNDFSANEYILAGPGYTTEKLPEFRYVRLSDDLFSSHPGLLSYSTDSRGGYLRNNFTDPTAAELGFTRVGRSQAAFGIDPDQSIAERLRSEGYIEQGVWRADTRHELSSKLALGPVNVNPFAVGRATIYDNDFDEFSPEENDELRLWGAVGVTASTSIQRVYNDAESRLFDVHRLRHIIEPTATVYHAASTVDSADLPIYDDDVEGLAEGTTARIGISQTLQTDRGDFGRSRSVDFLVVDLELIWNDDERDIESLIPRYYDPRPELSSPGTFGRLDALWQATESLGLTTEWIYSFDSNQPARTSAGYIIRHTPQLTSSGELRFLNPQNVTYADFAAQYALTDKYSFSGTVSFDVDEGDFRRARLGLRREFPGFFVRVDFVYDNVQDETSFGFTVLPIGVPTFARELD